MTDLKTMTAARIDADLNDVSFEVLLRRHAERPADTIDVPDNGIELEDLRFCLNWFAARGITVKATTSGLRCETPREMFEFLFGVTLNRRAPAAGAPAFEIDGTLKLPRELASLVDRISLQPS